MEAAGEAGKRRKAFPLARVSPDGASEPAQAGKTSPRAWAFPLSAQVAGTEERRKASPYKIFGVEGKD